jgi:hypothetical protein
MHFVFRIFNIAFNVNKYIQCVGFSVGFNYGKPTRTRGRVKPYYALFIGRNTGLYRFLSGWASFYGGFIKRETQSF